ncbi:MAG TPA: polysaccharide biosynthesis tyrosine autokinase [Pyrinomonadaceae bacterium]|nr:polysaccharide biosynthesis tyrosine autokinase [Pyrinomonadaceae bacterium]
MKIVKRVPDNSLLDVDRPSQRFADLTLADYRYGTAMLEEEGQLKDYWRAISERKWLVISVVALLTTLAAVYTIQKPNEYEAQARVQVDLERVNPALGASKDSPIIVGNSTTDPAYFNTQVQNFTAPGLLRRVVKQLNLEHTNDLAPLPVESYEGGSVLEHLRKTLGLGGKTDPADQGHQGQSTDLAVSNSEQSADSTEDPEEAARLAPYVEALLKKLAVEPVRENHLTEKETRLIDVRFTHQDRKFAAKVVNAIVDSFVLSNLERKTESNASTAHFLSERIAELQSQIRNSEQQLIEYAKSHQILSLDANENMVVERLAGLNKQLLEAENERKFAEAAYNAGRNPAAASAIAEGNTVADANARSISENEVRLAELKQRKAQLLIENTEKWPEVREVTHQIKALEDEIAKARNRATTVVVTNLETRYSQALEREKALRAAYQQQTSQTLVQNEAAVNYKILQSEIETNKTLLDGLLQRSKENDIVLAGTPNNIHVVDHAIVPYRPAGPKRLLNITLAFFISLGLGIGLALALDYLDDSLKSLEDVEKLLRLPTLTLIPTVGRTRARGLLRSKRGKGPTTGGTAERPELLIDGDLRSPLAEAYRQLRTSILLSTAEHPPQTLLITSSFPAEGKTSTSVNTAISLAQTGAKVLIIDADMRRPQIKSIFNLPTVGGLSTILSRKMDDVAILSLIEQIDGTNLFVLPAGDAPPNPAELLGSNQMRRLLESLKSFFTHIVIDSPPVASFTDGVLISSMVDGVLLVVHGSRSSRTVVQRSKKRLQDVGAKICGVVLNNVEQKASDSYYGYNDYYYKTESRVIEAAAE